MKNSVSVLLVLVVISTVTSVFAQEAPSQTTPPILQQLQTDLNDLSNGQLTVAVLQLLVAEKLADLREKQAVFCDRYGLDLNKWRQGLYQFDQNQGKFVEKQTGQ